MGQKYPEKIYIFLIHSIDMEDFAVEAIEETIHERDKAKKKGENYGIDICQTLERTDIQDYIYKMGNLANRHMVYMATAYSDFMTNNAHIAGFFAEEKLLDSAGEFLSYIKKSFEAKNEVMPEGNIEIPDFRMAKLGDDIDEILNQYELYLESANVHATNYLDEIKDEKPIAIGSIDQISDDATKGFYETLSKMHLPQEVKDTLADSMQKHIFTTLTKIYKAMDEDLFPADEKINSNPTEFYKA